MKAAYLVFLTVIVGCNSDETNNDSSNTGRTDITDANFTNVSTNCSQYAGSYSSNVLDIKNSIEFMGDIIITDNGSSCTIISNDIPNHDFNDQTAAFATNASEQNKSFTISQSPTFAGSITDLNLGQVNAIFLNGVVLDILPAACYGVGSEPLGREAIGCGPDQIDNPWRYDPMSSLNNFGTDAHNAHVQPDGTYHYHGNPVAMFIQDCSTVESSSPVIGFAADGFPVYGSCITDSNNGGFKAAQSSFQLRSGLRTTHEDAGSYTTPVAGQGLIDSNSFDGQFRGDYEYVENSGDLDECNGRTVDGQYGYYITNQFPWAIACYKGTTDPSFSLGPTRLQNRMHGH